MSSGSETRKRGERLTIRFDKEEYAAILKLAEAHGQSPGALARNRLIGTPLPRTRRPKATDRLVGQYLAATARVNDSLKPIDATLGKIGSNVNQLTHYAHLDRVMANSIAVALRDLSDAVANLKEAMDDVKELRTMGMQALGLEPPNHGGKGGGE